MSRELLVQRWADGYGAALVVDDEVEDVALAPIDGAAMPGALHLARVDQTRGDIGLTFVMLEGEVPAALEAGKESVAPGDRILVQVSGPARDGKPLRVRRRVTLPGQLVVLHPGSSALRIARRAQRALASRAMAGALHERAPAGCGLTIRSAAARAPDDALVAELDRLSRLWRAIEARLPNAALPSVLYADPPAWRAALPLLRAEPSRLLVNERRLVREFEAFGVVATLTEDGDLFDHAGVGEALARSEGPVVTLQGGGTLTIERTRALLAIDIDSGGQDVATTNLRAVREIARQLRLRDAMGTILIDFIRAGAAQQRRTERELETAVALDRRHLDLLGWTRGGLFELRRSDEAAE